MLIFFLCIGGGVLLLVIVFILWLVLGSVDENRMAYLLQLIREEGGDLYGLQIMGIAPKSFGPSNVYPLLRMAERRGYLTHREEIDSTNVRGGRPRYRYSLTEQGREFLEANNFI